MAILICSVCGYQVIDRDIYRVNAAGKRIIQKRVKRTFVCPAHGTRALFIERIRDK